MDDPREVIAEAEVLVVQFGWLAERLLVDQRRSDEAGPYIRVVQPVRTPQERIRQLREWRPGFNDPETYVFFPWPGRVEAFVRRASSSASSTAAATTPRRGPTASRRSASCCNSTATTCSRPSAGARSTTRSTSAVGRTANHSP